MEVSGKELFGEVARAEALRQKGWVLLQREGRREVRRTVRGLALARYLVLSLSELGTGLRALGARSVCGGFVFLTCREHGLL